MEEGDECQIIGGIIFAFPKDLWLMCPWVSDRRVTAFKKGRKPLMFASLTLGLEGVEGE